MIGAAASESVGKVFTWLASDSPELVQKIIGSARIAEVNALANHALSASLYRNLTDIASRVTNPTALVYWEKLIAQAATDMNASRVALASARGLPQNLELADLTRRAYGEKVATAIASGVGTLAGGAYTALKLKDIIDNPQGKSADDVVLGYRKELINYSSTAIGELTAGYRSFVSTGVSSLRSSFLIRWTQPQNVPAAVVSGSSGARMLWSIGRAGVAGALASLAYEAGWFIGAGNENRTGFKDLIISSDGTTVQEWFSRGIVEPVMVSLFEDPRARSESVAMLSVTLSRIAPTATVDQLSQLLKTSTNQDDHFKESVRLFAEIYRMLTGSDAPETATTEQAFAKQVSQLLSQYSGTAFTGPLTMLGKTVDANNIAQRYALTRLNDFAIDGLDYSRFNTAGQLDLFNPVTNRGTLTRDWIADRSAMLQAKVQVNTLNAQLNPNGYWTYPVSTDSSQVLDLCSFHRLDISGRVTVCAVGCRVIHRACLWTRRRTFVGYMSRFVHRCAAPGG